MSARSFKCAFLTCESESNFLSAPIGRYLLVKILRSQNWAHAQSMRPCAMAMSLKRSGKRFAGLTLTKRLKRSNFASAARLNPATREALCQPLKVSFEQMFGYYFPAQPERFHSPHTSALSAFCGRQWVSVPSGTDLNVRRRLTERKVSG